MLIIGGGDGGTLREVLKHPNIDTAILVDIDEEVVKMSQKYFPNIAGNISFTHPKAQVYFKDGSQWVASRKLVSKRNLY